MVQNVLVMGGTRFNGRACVLELLKHGHRVTTFNRGQTPDDLPSSVGRLHGDRHDRTALADALSGLEFDCIVDASAYSREEDVEPLLEIMRSRIGHYIFVSSTGLYTSPAMLPVREGVPVEREKQTPYGWDKLDIEEYLFREYRAGGTPATTVAISMVFGPHNLAPDREQRMFARFCLDRPVLIPGDGNVLQQIGHVDDQARAFRMMMGNPITFGKRYNVTGADYWSDNTYVDVFERVLGIPAERLNVPAAVMDEIWETDRRPASSLVQRLGTAYRWNEHMLFSIDRARTDLGWQPEYTFEAAVEQTWRWFVDTGRRESVEFDWAFEDALIERTR